MIRRAGLYLFAALATLLGCAAAADLYWHGRLTMLDPVLLGCVVASGIALLLFGIVSLRDRATDLRSRAEQLSQLTRELETSNAGLQDSEGRYKGLLDAQGDVILRRAPHGRITYANEA